MGVVALGSIVTNTTRGPRPTVAERLVDDADGGRADVGAVGVAEEHEHGPARERRQRERLPVLVGELEGGAGFTGA